MIKKYVKKPIPIEAIQWDGTNTKELFNFSKDIRFIYHEAAEDNVSIELYVNTLEGDLYAKVGDYIIKGVRGEVYPCARDIFEETYEEVNVGFPI
jgi:hypothetical protein